ncbi:S41 family peptidase [Siphonobacter sp. BAB-5385]|uniref:S41 family peptidase n=1 Tax=Siphonobacter sp. BAB-5385 TaxID=1864822 RepID=UPI0015959E58|nr:S41 family peptidase [Siphonobacter sp. BAB-5385]
MKSALVVLVILLTLLPTHAQTAKTTPENAFTPQQLQQDFGLTRQLFEMMHPALYDVIAKEKLDRLWDSTSRLLDHKLTAFEFFNLLSPIISQLGCGHTGVGLPTSEREYINRYVPVKVKFLRGKAYIIADQDNDPSLLGSEVLSINGQPMTVITAELFKHISTDGINSANRYFHLDNKFDLYYGLHIAQPDTFRLLIRSGNKPDSVVILPATTKRVTRSKVGLISSSPKRDRPFSISLPNAETAVLTIDQFYIALDDDKSKETVYKQFLDSCFTLIRQKQVRNLVIDLRKNSGGYGTWGAWLYAYLAEKPFNYYKEAVVTTNQDLPFIQYTDWKQTEYRDYVKDITKTPSGQYRWTAHDNLKMQQPQPTRFNGPVYILIGRKCFSTTAEFCAVAYSNKRATFIGEETGGGYYSINGGDMMEMILPNTKVKLVIPMRKYVMAVESPSSPGHGTLPDYWIEPTISEFLSGKDVEMNFTLALIKKNRK